MHHVHASIGGLIHRERQVIEMLNSGTFIVEEKETDGQLVAIYDWRGKYEEGESDISSCVPVKKEFKAEGIRFERMKKAACYSLIHKGPCGEIGRTYQPAD